MNKHGIICDGCPVRSFCAPVDSYRPTHLGVATPVSQLTARHHNVSGPAVAYEKLTTDGRIVRLGHKVVVSASVGPEQVVNEFEHCKGPVVEPVQLRLPTWEKVVTLLELNSCSALIALDLLAEQQQYADPGAR